MGDAFDARRRALEAAFFDVQDARLRRALRERGEREQAARELARACGVRDPHTLDLLVAQGLRAESLAALLLVPLVAVAWADDELGELERLELLQQGRSYGIEAEGAAGQLLRAWLREPPPPELLEAWLGFARSVAAELDPEQRALLAADLVGRARQVAQAEGGVLRVGRRISDPERAVLVRIETAFAGTDAEA